MENIFQKEKQRSKGSNPSAKKLKSLSYSSSALIVYSPAEMSQLNMQDIRLAAYLAVFNILLAHSG